MWTNLCGGTANLKFRQFNSAVCDAFGVIWVVWGFAAIWSCFGGVRMVGQPAFDVLYAELCGWGLLICMLRGAGHENVFRVHVFCFFRTRTVTLTNCPAWGVGF